LNKKNHRFPVVFRFARAKNKKEKAPRGTRSPLERFFLVRIDPCTARTNNAHGSRTSSQKDGHIGGLKIRFFKLPIGSGRA
jgi:hypothetical protein